MPEFKKILCLANSRKPGGRCVAGKIYDIGQPGSWIRPVSARPSEEVSEIERQYDDGMEPSLLDIIEIPVKKKNQKDFQIENFIIEDKKRWVKTGTVSKVKLRRWTDDPEKLWLNNSSSYSGLNDRVSFEDSDSLRGSLYFIELNDLKLRVFAPGSDFDNPKRRVQAKFTFNGLQYHLRVTDPVIERHYLADDDGTFSVGEAFATISLTRSFDDYCYKLVVALIIS